jgi:hypothetical protein
MVHEILLFLKNPDGDETFLVYPGDLKGRVRSRFGSYFLRSHTKDHESLRKLCTKVEAGFELGEILVGNELVPGVRFVYAFLSRDTNNPTTEEITQGCIQALLEECSGSTLLATNPAWWEHWDTVTETLKNHGIDDWLEVKI